MVTRAVVPSVKENAESLGSDMKSFRLNPVAVTHWSGIFLAWCAFIGLCSAVGIRILVLTNRDGGRHLANPDHWTRSLFLTLIVGCGVGLVIGALHIVVRWFKRRVSRRKNDIVHEWMRRVLQLPIREQSMCVWLAAEPTVPLWESAARLEIDRERTSAYLECYQRWIAGVAGDAQLREAAELYRERVPEDMSSAMDAIGGMAGWSLLDVSMIALDQCEDVHDDILKMAVLFAAAAATQNGRIPFGMAFRLLSDPEMAYIRAWWQKCIDMFPQLASP